MKAYFHKHFNQAPEDKIILSLLTPFRSLNK